MQLELYGSIILAAMLHLFLSVSSVHKCLSKMNSLITAKEVKFRDFCQHYVDSKKNSLLILTSVDRLEKIITAVAIERRAAIIKSATNARGMTILHCAAFINEGSAIKNILKNVPYESWGSLMMLPDSNGYTAPSLAAIKGHVDSLQLLLTNISDERKCSLLRNPNLVVRILSKPSCWQHYTDGLDPDQLNQILERQEVETGRTALHIAAIGGSTDIFKSILRLILPENLLNFLFKKDGRGNTFIHTAVENSLKAMKLWIKTLKQWINHQHVLNLLSCQKSNGVTALHIAAQKEKFVVGKEILHDFSPDDKFTLTKIVDASGNTAVHTALLYGNLAVFGYLLDNVSLDNRKAILQAANNDELTPFNILAKMRSVQWRDTVTEVLNNFERFYFLKQINGDGKSLLWVEIENGNHAIAKNLLPGLEMRDQLELLKITDNQDKSVVHHLMSSSDLFQLLVDIFNIIGKENIWSFLEIVDDSGETAVHLAARNGNLKAMNWVVTSLSADEWFELLTMHNKHGQTLLHLAAAHGFIKITQCILDPLQSTKQLHLLNAKDDKQKTAEECASLNKHKAINSYLLQCRNKAGTTGELFADFECFPF